MALQVVELRRHGDLEDICKSCILCTGITCKEGSRSRRNMNDVLSELLQRVNDDADWALRFMKHQTQDWLNASSGELDDLCSSGETKRTW
jgi:hypothetical protein